MPDRASHPLFFRWVLLNLISLAAAASMWFYVDKILIGHQVADAAAHNYPRGNLSDLYPRWLGTRELLRHGRNPYSSEITAEIQKGYYGRPLDPAAPSDPTDRQAFAYPVYVVFLLAPTIWAPFPLVQSFFGWLLLGFSATAVWWWLKALRWKLSPGGTLFCVVLLLGSFPEVQGVKLQQLSLLVAAMLAGAMASVSGGQLLIGGAILALATIKPQLALPLAIALMAWALGDLKSRWRFVAGFAVTMGLLLVASEFVLPGWLKMFWQGIREYRQYTGNQSALDQLANWGVGTWAGSVLAAIAVVATTALLWRVRADSAASDNFGGAVALVIALTVLAFSRDSTYNQVLLLPSVLMLGNDHQRLISKSRPIRIAYVGGICVLCWPWATSLALVVVWCFSPSIAVAAWKLPLYATFAFPVLVFMLTFVSMCQRLVLRARVATR